MKKMLAILMMLVICCTVLLAVPVCAKEEVDHVVNWDNVDWETADLSDYLEDMYYFNTWTSWMEKYASLEKLMEVAKAKPDGAYAAAYAYALGIRFMQEPQAVIRALAQADGDHRERIARLIATSEAYLAEKVDIVKLLTELKLPADATAEEKAALNMIIGYVEQYNNVEIPRTGDPIALVMGLMALSGTCLAVMAKRKELA